MIARVLEIARFAAGDVLWKLANIAILAVAARVLPETQAALVVLSQTASMIMLSLGDLGFRSTGIRLVAISRAQAIEIARAVFARRALATALLGLPAALLCSAVMTDEIEAFTGLSLMVLAYLPYFMARDWVLLGLSRTDYVALARLSYALVVLFMAALALVLDVDVEYFAATMACGYLTFFVVSALLLDKVDAPSSAGQSPVVNIGKELTWRNSFALAVSFSLLALFHSIEIIMIGALLGEAASATFAVPFRLIFSIYTLGWILAQYFSPQFSRDALEGGGRHWSSYLAGFLACGAIVGLATYGAAPWLVAIVYGGAFPESATLLRMLSPTIALDAGVACLGTILVMQNRGVVSAVTIGCACLASAAILLLFVHHGVFAAVYAKFASYLALLLAQLIILLNAKPIR